MNARDPLLEMVSTWQSETSAAKRTADPRRILDQLGFLERIKFTPYVPTFYSSQPTSFKERLRHWLGNPGLTLEEKRDLFEFAYHIAFFSFDDFAALFQSAFTGPISRWCLNQAGLRLDQSDWQSRLDEERFDKTWFCPVTDSLLISVFHHVNGIEDKDRKPAFRELMHFGDETENVEQNKIHKHIRDKGYQKLALLEDFVGTGGQSLETVEWAVRTLKIPVLFCPMIIAPEGAQKYRDLEEKLDVERRRNPDLPAFAFEPVLELDPGCFVHPANPTDADLASLLDRIRQLAVKIHNQLSESQQQCKEGALGFGKKKSQQKGATLVMFSNTPNNSLPLIHHGADNWAPLFPRVARQPL